MMWIGLIVGAILGGLFGQLPGAITFGFLGWLAGLIIKSQKQKPTPSPTTPTPGPGTGQVPGTGAGQVSTWPVPGPGVGGVPVDHSAWTMEDRVAWLERRVVELEGRMAAGAVATARLEQTVAPDAAEAATVGGPSAPEAAEIGSPAIAAEAAPGTTKEAAIAAEAAPGTTKEAAIAAEAAPDPEVGVPPPPPPAPNPVIAWLTGGNTIARVGLLILFIGLAFLLKYAADQSLFPPELRIAAVAAGGIALLAIGWRLRFRNAGYALGMQGAGVAVLYLTTFGALRLFHLIPPELAFFLLVGIAVFSAILAVRQDAVALAVIGAGGGFLAPILASTGKGSHVMLFSYYLVLNLGILAIAWYKAWRPLNLTGFVFTFGVFWFLGDRSYTPESYESTQPFLIAFFLLYVALAILVAREKSDSKADRYVDGTLVFGVPLAAFALQAELVGHMEHGPAISALVVAALYIGLAWWLLRTARESWKLLAQSFIALGVVFVTVAIPLALDARWTSATWAAEGAAILWVSLKQGRRAGRWFGLLLQLLAAIAYLGSNQQHGEYPLIDAAFTGAAIIALAGLWAHRLLLNNREAIGKVEGLLVTPLFIWGLGWTIGAGLDEIDAHVAGESSLGVAVLFFAAVALAFRDLARRWAWTHAAWAAKGLLPVLYVMAILITFDQGHPMAAQGWLSWMIAFGALLWILRDTEPEDPTAIAMHAGSAILLALVGAIELNWLAAKYTAHGTAWSSGAVAFWPSLVLFFISLRSMDSDKGVVGRHPRAYHLHAASVITAALAVWSLFANLTHDARSDPLPYMPVINALDLAHIFAILAVFSAWKAAKRTGVTPPEGINSGAVATLAGGLGFIWLTAILLRTVSHWGGVPYTQGAMMKSVLAQASLSIFWALLALTAMIYATRTARRPVWVVGAVLMGVVVAKLFLIDLSNVGGIARIVSFIAVGVLMLVIGYFSPVPPRKPESQSQ